MARDRDIELTIDMLFEMGVLSREGCRKFANMVRSIQNLTFPTAMTRAAPAPRARKARTARRRGARRGKFQITKTELRELYKTKTAKQIAEQHGVSVPAVTQRLSKWGIQKEGRATTKPAKKGARRKATKKRAKKRTAKKAGKK